ncbi:MAG TPA: PilZ domain-containing protein [Pyrinomonadaceae bacterium]|nr:PilZ domain-containing protein [Pyrinomonadaceae bacterium]
MLSTNNQIEYHNPIRHEALVNSSPVGLGPAERRISPRVSVSLEALWEALSGRREARVSDISLHGCFLEACGQTSVGERMRFLLKTPSGRWINLCGEVVFYQPMVGFGLRFTELSALDQAMLRQLVEFYS